MLRRLIDMFRLPGSKPIVKKRSSKDGESITEDEGLFIAYCYKNKLPSCPDCQEGHLIEGPQGAGSNNCLCNNCLSEFSIYWISEGELIGERISDPRGCKEERLRTVYGIAQKVD